MDIRTFNVSASAWDTGQERSALLAVKNMPAAGAWVDLEGTNNGVASADFAGDSATSARVVIQFRPGAQLTPGTYRDTITVKVCADDQCATQFVTAR